MTCTLIKKGAEAIKFVLNLHVTQTVVLLDETTALLCANMAD